LPAKAAQLNVKQYNGYFGCITCYHPGQYIARIFRFFYDIVVKNLFKFTKLVNIEIEEDIFDIIKCNQLRKVVFL
jgi:hypothetical protein